MIIYTRPNTGRPTQRSGTVIALLALTIVVLIGFLGLAIDLGMLAIAKTQAQQAADLAALTAARTVNGDKSTTYNQSGATTNAKNILTYNYVLGQTIANSALTLSYGSYDYNQTTQAFATNFPALTNVPTTAVTSTVTTSNLAGAFSKVFGSSFLPNVSASATAVHRPRDIALVMDLSSSMRYGTLLGFEMRTSSRATNNPDTNVPTFGHYSSSSAVMTGPTTNRTSSYSNYTVSPSNTTAATSSYALTYINGFYQNDANASTLIRAFDSYTSTDGGVNWSAPSAGATPQLPPTSYTSVPGGDVPLFTSGSTTVYAKTINDVVGQTGTPGTRNKSWELDGYSNYLNGSVRSPSIDAANYANNPFYGYTKGPNYYGKTFFLWPPDPRRPLNTGTATAWSTTASDQATINQFLQDFGYGSATDLANAAFMDRLAAAITTTSATSLTLNGSTPFPISALPGTTFKIKIDNEIMIVTAASGTGNKTLTIQRGKDGTTAATHANSATVALVTQSPLAGISGAATLLGSASTGSQTWPWPSGDTGAGSVAGTLSKYLTTQVYIPVSVNSTARLLTTSDAVFKKIMRLYNWDYIIDGTGGTWAGRTACDWRIRFFGTDDNTKIFNASGSLNPPGSTGMCSATTTYNEILRWLTMTTDPFPTQMRSGRIRYYSSIPTSITGTWPNYGGADQRFWVEVIDHILGFRQTAAGSYTDISGMCGYGNEFTWGTMAATVPPGNPSGAIQYMSYTDNPLRPLLQHWFSPILMVDYMHNYNMYSNTAGYFVMQPGNSYEAPIYTGRQAFMAAVDTMQDNHPNDWFTLITYSLPKSSASDTNQRFNCVRCPLGTNYAYATSSLLFPFSTINADGTSNNTEITPYDTDPANNAMPSANFVDTPRAKGGTCFSMGLMLAYNQFAVTTTSDTTLRSFVTNTPITFPTGMAGGLGRKGTQKVVIFETDGLPDAVATASLVTNGTYNYYKIRYDMNRPGASEYPAANETTVNDPPVLTETYALVDQLKATYGSTRNPFRLYAIGFGPVFAGTDAASALSTLQAMQYHAGTQASASTALPSNQIITGTDAQMLSNMTTTFTNILQNGIQIALIK